MGAETADPIEFKVATPGADASAAAMNAVAHALKQMTDSLNGTAPAAKKAGDALDGAKRQAKQADDAMRSAADGTRRVASTINVLTGAVADASPEMAGFVSAVGRSGAAISNMSALLGGGLGIATGGLIALFGIYTQHMADAKKAAEELADAEKEQAKATAEVTKAQYEQRDAANALANTFGKTGDVNSAEARVAQAQRTLGTLGSETRDIGGVKLVNTRAVAARKELAEAKKDLEDAKAKRGKYAVKGKELPGLDLDKATNSGEERLSLEAADRAQKQLDERQKFLDSAAKGGEASKSLKEQGHAAVLAANKSKLDHEFDQQREFYEKQEQLKIDYEEKVVPLDKKAQQRVAMMREFGVEAYKGVAGAALTSAVAIAAGQKMSTKQVLAGIGEQLIALGIKNELEGSANLIFGNPGGAVAMGIGAAEIVAGIAMGGGKGGAGGSGGGASGGGASQQRFWDPNASDHFGRHGKWSKGSAISPTATLARDMGGGGGTINVYQSSVISPGPQDAINIHRALREGERHGVSA